MSQPKTQKQSRLDTELTEQNIHFKDRKYKRIIGNYFPSTLAQGLKSCQRASPTNGKWHLMKCGNSSTDRGERSEKAVIPLSS